MGLELLPRAEFHVLGTDRLPTKRIRGVRAALKRATEARIVIDVL